MILNILGEKTKHHTYTFVIGHELVLALALGVGKLAQLRRRPHEQLLPDFAVLPAEGQVIRHVASVGHAVDVSAQSY